MNFVVGSGPAGVAVAHALLEQGQPVTMIDAGTRLEPEAAELLASLGGMPPPQWRQRTAKPWGSDRPSAGIPRKLCYGSDFAYRDAEQKTTVRQLGVCVRSSFALGGLSNVWGGAVLPFRAAEMAAWPEDTRDLAEHYRAICDLMPLSAVTDRLAADLPLYGTAEANLKASRQATELFETLRRSEPALAAEGINFGWSRLAVHAAQPTGGTGEGCAYCGLCLRGCPRQLVYSSATTVERFRSHPNFQYIGDFVVDELREEGGKVLLRGRQGGAAAELSANRAYLAAGVLGTARIMLASMDARDMDLAIKDSQYFLVPMLSFRRTAGVREDPLHTLSQIFLEMDGRATGAMPAHLQCYGYNDMYLEMIQRRMGPLFKLGEALANAFLERLLALQGYLHSDDSSTISVAVRRQGPRTELTLRPVINPKAHATVSRILAKLSRCRKLLGAQVLSPLCRLGAPGEGSHLGGLFPMRDNPGVFETDTLGRVRGFSKVHIVDATVLPSVPATTITLPVMANAHRIGSLFRLTDDASDSNS